MSCNGDIGLHQVDLALAGVCSAREMPHLLRTLCSLFVAVLLSFSLSTLVATPALADEADPQTQAAIQQLEEAFADAYEQAQGDDAVTADVASSLDDEDAQALTTETIDDDGTPLAASPGEEEILDDENPLAANPYATPVYDFAWVLLGMAVAVAAFFLVLTNRLNKSIDKMRRFVD